jgi:4-diphosphocytidyl-2-C-methyl-D-erythritol kinase
VVDGNFNNVFECAAYQVFDGLERFRRLMLEAGAAAVHLAGAGPTLFSIHSSEYGARRLLDRLQGFKAYLAETLDSGESCLNRLWLRARCWR